MPAASKNVDVEMVAAALDSSTLRGAKMLAAGFKHAASTPVSERHHFQGQLLEMIGTALQEGEQAAERERQATQDKTEQETQALENATVAIKDAVNAMLEANKAASEAEEVAATKQEEHAKARVATLDPEKLRQKLLSRKENLKQEYEKATNVAEGPLSMLCQGGWEDDEVREAALDAVSDLLKSSTSEATLRAAVPHAFAKKPEQRQEFDKVIEEAAVQVITAEVNKRQAELAGSEQEAEDAQAEALGLQVIAEFAEEAAVAAEADVTNAKEALTNAEAQKAQAEEVAAQRQTGIEALGQEQERIVQQASLLRDAMTSLSRVVSGEVPAAEEEPPQKRARVEPPEDVSEQKENCMVNSNAMPTATEPLKANAPLQEAVVMIA